MGPLEPLPQRPAEPPAPARPDPRDARPLWRAHHQRLVGAPAGLLAGPGPDVTAAWVAGDGTRWWGLGEVARLEASDRAGALALADRCRAFLSEAVAAPIEARALLRWFGGLAFDPDHAADPSESAAMAGALGPWPAGAFWLPECLVRLDAQGCDFIVIARDTPGAAAAAPDDLVARYAARLGAPVAVAPWAPAQTLAAPGARGAWAAGVSDAVAAIAAARLRKVVLARAVTLALATPDALPRAFEALVTRSPDTQRFWLRPARDRLFWGASPELLFAQDGERLAVDGLAGTAPRGASPQEDEALGQALLGSAKDRHEHAVVVDFIAEALAPHVSALVAPELPGLRRLPSVQHLHTPMAATLPPGAPLAGILAALHPTPAVCGAPREAARAWIATHEPGGRGWYAGAVGWVAGSSACFAVGIRSASASGERAHVHVGAGLVAGSTAEAEWTETERKAAPLLALLTGALP